MKCMRCGTGIDPDAVFCDTCLSDMEKHPVDPSTPITLPNRNAHPIVKRSKKRFQKPENLITNLRRLIAVLIILVILLALSLTCTVYMLFQQDSANDKIWLPGQNYGTSAAK